MAFTQSIVMRSKTGTVRIIETEHNLALKPERGAALRQAWAGPPPRGEGRWTSVWRSSAASPRAVVRPWVEGARWPSASAWSAGDPGRVWPAAAWRSRAASRLPSAQAREWLPDPSTCTTSTVPPSAWRRRRRGRRVGLIGDYDVDGATATACSGALSRPRREVSIEIPDRLRDGYGPNAAAIDQLAAPGCRLMLRRYGTTAFEALEAAARGQVIVVVDHTRGRGLPLLSAVVNPNRMDHAACSSPWPRSASPS